MDLFLFKGFFVTFVNSTLSLIILWSLIAKWSHTVNPSYFVSFKDTRAVHTLVLGFRVIKLKKLK